MNNESVTQVKTFKYLGVLLSDDMTWRVHVGSITSKANKRLFFLRKLNQAGVDKSIMEMFYNSVVMSVMTYCVSLFYNALNSLDKKKLERICSIAQKIIGHNSSLDTIFSIYNKQILAEGKQIYNYQSHPLNQKFNALPSGRRLRSASTKSVKYNKTFVPSAIITMNMHDWLSTLTTNDILYLYINFDTILYCINRICK